MKTGGGAADGRFQETELRLGLPGGSATIEQVQLMKSGSKRGFSETHVDLKLNLQTAEDLGDKFQNSSITTAKANAEPIKPPSKAQVVGWPPVRSFRKSILTVHKSGTGETEKINGGDAALVKVSMDGAPYLRKVDLKIYQSYQQLSASLAKMFSCFTIGNCGYQGMIDFMNESKLMDLLNGSDYVPTYEDKDGDWMLVGDVPWEMFVDSCKRLRIMKGKEAVDLAPRAMERCKKRT